jgi:hypothetical protein
MVPINRWVSESERPTRNKILPLAEVPVATSTQSASCALEHFFSEARLATWHAACNKQMRAKVIKAIAKS